MRTGRVTRPPHASYRPGAAETTWSRAPLAAHREHLDPRQVLGRGASELRVAIRADAPDGRDRVAQLVVRCAGAERLAEVVSVCREEAGVELAVGGQPGAGAVPAERLRDRRDDADFAASVAVPPP